MTNEIVNDSSSNLLIPVTCQVDHKGVGERQPTRVLLSRQMQFKKENQHINLVKLLLST